MFTNAQLYNCQTGLNEPDWRGFTSLEIGGCKDDDGSTDWGIPFDEAEFFTIYGRDHDGMAEAITDIPRDGAVLQIAAHLARRSRLPLSLSNPI